jgi:hypothetical protein
MEHQFDILAAAKYSGMLKVHYLLEHHLETNCEERF